MSARATPAATSACVPAAAKVHRLLDSACWSFACAYWRPPFARSNDHKFVFFTLVQDAHKRTTGLPSLLRALAAQYQNVSFVPADRLLPAPTKAAVESRAVLPRLYTTAAALLSMPQERLLSTISCARCCPSVHAAHLSLSPPVLIPLTPLARACHVRLLLTRVVRSFLSTRSSPCVATRHSCGAW